MSQSNKTALAVDEQLRSYVPHEHEELPAYARRSRLRKRVPSLVVARPLLKRTS